jgi:hypothetical protein
MCFRERKQEVPFSVSQLPSYGNYSHVVHGLSDNMRLMYK